MPTVRVTRRVHFAAAHRLHNPEFSESRNRVELGAGTRADADIAREWRLRGMRWLSRLEARLAVDNVFAATTYDQCALPQPGRLARLQLRLH